MAEQYLYLDLEVNQQENIYQIGFYSDDLARQFTENELDIGYKNLKDFKEQGYLICGHNFRRFDHQFLIKEDPNFIDWLIIDTLELSILVFPLEPSHKLDKDYKLTKFSANNPLEDAKATRLLLETIQKLLQDNSEISKIYSYILSCGETEADLAYQKFFASLNLVLENKPNFQDLPQSLINTLDLDYLEYIWKNIEAKDFETRLCLAGILAWNEQRKGSGKSFCHWLEHLKSFTEIWCNLRPLPDYNSYKEYFKIDDFRGKQESAIKAILNQENPLVIIPTGGGKSLCYQLPALMLFKQQLALTVVISPLQALMADQVKELEENDLDFATFINSTISAQDRSQRLKQIRECSKGLLYISPESLRSISIRRLLQEKKPALWVIDEAHCISQWGHDFRPDYRYIAKYIQELYQEQELPLFCLTTATARKSVREDIKKLFEQDGIKIKTEIISDSMNRSNLNYQVIPTKGNKDGLLVNEVKKYQEQGAVLVYTTTRKKAEELATLLNNQGISADFYHGKLSNDKKRAILDKFKSEDLNIITATCAFGMGINRKDVRAVIHYNLSANLEGYMQESGRAGRDNKESECTLFFEEDDADLIFFIKSLNQLTPTDLKNIFIAIRKIRDLLYKQASEEWFWVTIYEIFQTSDLDERFATESDQRDTKIKVALYHLENFGLIERAENLTSYIKFDLIYHTPEESIKQFDQETRSNNLSLSQIKQFKKLIYTMHKIKNFNQNDNNLTLDLLSDESGFELDELKKRIKYLTEIRVCSTEIPLIFLVNKEKVKNRLDAKTKHDQVRKLEIELLDKLLEIEANNEQIFIDLREMTTILDPDGSQKLKASHLMNILEGWVLHKWIYLTRIKQYKLKINQLDQVLDNIENYQYLTSNIVDILLKKVRETETKLKVNISLSYEFGELLKDLNKNICPLTYSEKELEIALSWLHQQEIIRITEGLSLFHQSLKIKVFKGKEYTIINKEYPKLEKYYQEQNWRTHIMLKYGEIKDPQERKQLVNDYFELTPEAFNQKYNKTEIDILPVLKQDYEKIVGSIKPINQQLEIQNIESQSNLSLPEKPIILNEIQRKIVESDEPVSLVIAGPGSGKTRTIVHKIAYLVKVKRISPERILLLAYNRNAVTELKLRLKNLIGEYASHLRVYTFHGLALALLGRNLGEMLSKEDGFKQLLKEACESFKTDEDDEYLDHKDLQQRQAKRIEVLGNLDYIFVDEYQDVAEDEYNLIKLASGLGDSEENNRSVQINLCVIGDDDQNLYEQLKETSVKYIQEFETEYKAKKYLLTENYRSTESIIEVANKLIQHNSNRCKQYPHEQVKIDIQRQGLKGKPVINYQFNDSNAQAFWIAQIIQNWINGGTKAKDIAILAPQWESLKLIRLLLEEKFNINSYALTNANAVYKIRQDKEAKKICKPVKLHDNYITYKLIEELRIKENLELSSDESVKNLFINLFKQWERNLDEPTIKILLKLAHNLDLERGYGNQELAETISIFEIINAIYDYSNSKEILLDEDGVLITSCHGAKGLEFEKVILLTDDFLTYKNRSIEVDRRLFYVAMTRAKEELILCSTKSNQFIQEIEVKTEIIEDNYPNIITIAEYFDATPSDIDLGSPSHINTLLKNQDKIKNLKEGELLKIVVSNYGDSWIILTQDDIEIGKLSRPANKQLIDKGIKPKQFQFQLGEVKVKNIYHHFDKDDSEKIKTDWFIVIPQIRIFRER